MRLQNITNIKIKFIARVLPKAYDYGQMYVTFNIIV